MANINRKKTRVTLELLELLVAVTQHGSISAAARAWNISPSLAARKIALLESELNARLFDRTTRRVYLTDAGRMVESWAMDVIAGHAALFDVLAISQKKLAGTLRIVSNEYLLTAVLPNFLSDFSARFPEIRFTLTMSDLMVPDDKRDYDVAIYSGQAPDSMLKGMRIRNFRRVLCAAPSYLKRKGTPATIQSLTQHDCLVHQQAQEETWTFIKDRRIIRQKINVLALSSSHLPLIQLAKKGMGIVQVSRRAIEKELAAGELVTLLDRYECANSDGTRPATWVMYPANRDLNRTQVFVSELTRYLRSNPA